MTVYLAPVASTNLDKVNPVLKSTSKYVGISSPAKPPTNNINFLSRHFHTKEIIIAYYSFSHSSRRHDDDSHHRHGNERTLITE